MTEEIKTEKQTPLVCKDARCASLNVEVVGNPRYETVMGVWAAPGTRAPQREVIDYRCRDCDYVSKYEGSIH